MNCYENEEWAMSVQCLYVMLMITSEVHKGSVRVMRIALGYLGKGHRIGFVGVVNYIDITMG